MGAWIEILVAESPAVVASSHPTWVRGLKFKVVISVKTFDFVAPHVGAWIEIYIESLWISATRSHPTWVRGLKYRAVWERELKRCRTPRGCVD